MPRTEDADMKLVIIGTGDWRIIKHFQQALNLGPNVKCFTSHNAGLHNMLGMRATKFVPESA